MNYMPLFFAIVASVGVVFLVVLDKKDSLNNPIRVLIGKIGVENKKTAERMLSSVKGFALIILLAAVLGAVIFYSS